MNDAKLTSRGKPSQPYGRKLALCADFLILCISSRYCLCVSKCTLLHKLCSFSVWFFFWVFLFCLDNPDCACGQELWEGVMLHKVTFWPFFLNVQTVKKKSENTQTPLRRYGWMCFYMKVKRRKINEGQPCIIPVSVPMEVSWNQSL